MNISEEKITNPIKSKNRQPRDNSKNKSESSVEKKLITPKINHKTDNSLSNSQKEKSITTPKGNHKTDSSLNTSRNNQISKNGSNQILF